jgi:hypothetical protein
MKPRPLLLFLEFVALTVPLTWLWVAWAQDAYVGFFEVVLGPVLGALGVSSVADSPALKRFVSYVPFLVLIVITPGMSLRRRLVGGGVGVLLIFLCHLGLVVVEDLAVASAERPEDSFSKVFPLAVFADAFPFILWAVIANRFVRDLLSSAFSSPAEGAEP